MRTAARVRAGGGGRLFHWRGLQSQETEVSWLRGPGRRSLRRAGASRPTSTTTTKHWFMVIVCKHSLLF